MLLSYPPPYCPPSQFFLFLFFIVSVFYYPHNPLSRVPLPPHPMVTFCFPNLCASFRVRIYGWERTFSICISGSGLPWVTLISTLFFSSIHLTANFIFFYKSWIELCSVCTPHYHYLFSNWRTIALFSFPGYCEENSHELGWVSVSVERYQLFWTYAEER